MEKEPLKICIDCKHCIKSSLAILGEWDVETDNYFCARTVTVSTDKISGEQTKTYMRCDHQRAYQCGYHAIFFEPKPLCLPLQIWEFIKSIFKKTITP
jgi:hypothetical protein